MSYVIGHKVCTVPINLLNYVSFIENVIFWRLLYSPSSSFVSVDLVHTCLIIIQIRKPSLFLTQMGIRIYKYFVDIYVSVAVQHKIVTVNLIFIYDMFRPNSAIIRFAGYAKVYCLKLKYVLNLYLISKISIKFSKNGFDLLYNKRIHKTCNVKLSL
jgi:hypothetical protein